MMSLMPDIIYVHVTMTGRMMFGMLVLIYINDLPIVLSHSCADIFADDTTL